MLASPVFTPGIYPVLRYVSLWQPIERNCGARIGRVHMILMSWPDSRVRGLTLFLAV